MWLVGKATSVRYKCTYRFKDEPNGVIVISKKPIDIPLYQSNMTISFSVPPAILNEGISGHELYVWYFCNSNAEVTLSYDYTYYVRNLCHSHEGENEIIQESISDDYKEQCINEIHGTEPNRYNFHDPIFIKWYEEGNLHVHLEGENEYEFAIRVLQHIANSLEIRRENKGHTAVEVIQSKRTTCHGCNSIFIASMRRHNIPARCKHGCKLKKENVRPSNKFPNGWRGNRPLSKRNGHSKSEFFMEGMGWIPVESVIRKANKAALHIASVMENEPHLVKYYDHADPTTISTKDIAELFNLHLEEQTIELGQLSNVFCATIKDNTLSLKTPKSLTCYQRYDVCKPNETASK